MMQPTTTPGTRRRATDKRHDAVARLPLCWVCVTHTTVVFVGSLLEVGRRKGDERQRGGGGPCMRVWLACLYMRASCLWHPPLSPLHPFPSSHFSSLSLLSSPTLSFSPPPSLTFFLSHNRCLPRNKEPLVATWACARPWFGRRGGGVCVCGHTFSCMVGAVDGACYRVCTLHPRLAARVHAWRNALVVGGCA